MSIKSTLINQYYKFKYYWSYFKRHSFNLLSAEQTIDYIINTRCSLARFGDGEFKLAAGYLSSRLDNSEGIGFQQFDSGLARRLYEILNTYNPNYKIGLPSPIFGYNLGRMTSSARQHWKNQSLVRIDWLWNNVYRKQFFLDSFFTRFYIDYVDHSKSPDYVNKLKRIWDNRTVIIVEGCYTRLGIGNDLFDNAQSIKRIICPAKNAFRCINKIEDAIITVADSKDVLVLVALGPTATVIAADMSKSGIQTIDIGHIDIEYEWMLKKATKKIPIPGKYVNEARSENAYQQIQSSVYQQQICIEIE